VIRQERPAPIPPQYETMAEVAARYSVSTKTLRRRIAEGKLTAYRFGPHLIRVDPAEVDALLRPIPAATPRAAAASA
jgi:excisionase family DNA binding protein